MPSGADRGSKMAHIVWQFGEWGLETVLQRLFADCGEASGIGARLFLSARAVWAGSVCHLDLDTDCHVVEPVRPFDKLRARQAQGMLPATTKIYFRPLPGLQNNGGVIVTTAVGQSVVRAFGAASKGSDIHED